MATKDQVEVGSSVWRKRSLFIVAALVALASLLILLPPVRG